MGSEICPKNLFNHYFFTPLQLTRHRKVVFKENLLLLIFEEKGTKNRVS